MADANVNCDSLTKAYVVSFWTYDGLILMILMILWKDGKTVLKKKSFQRTYRNSAKTIADLLIGHWLSSHKHSRSWQRML